MLDYNALDDLARKYYGKDDTNAGKSLREIFVEVFNIDAEVERDIVFNRKQKLYIVAEEVSPVVRQVSEYLRDCYKINLNHLEYQVSNTKDGEYLISVEKTLGFDDNCNKEINQGAGISKRGWNGNGKVKNIVYQGVMEFTKNNINKTTVRCQLIQHCVNHSSRKHYASGQEDFYFYEDGSYRLYNKENDGSWDWQGKPIGLHK